jgi:hypothetical protein
VSCLTPVLGAGAEIFHMCWLHFEGDNAALNFDRARALLYGTMPVADLGLERAPRPATGCLGTHTKWCQCYYFSESAFSRYRETLDGVVLSRPGRLMLCVNSLSPQASRFRASSMARAFSESMVDPDRWERHRIAFILDPTIDRQDHATCLEYLRQKYHTGPLVAAPGTLSASGQGTPLGR